MGNSQSNQDANNKFVQKSKIENRMMQERILKNHLNYLQNNRQSNSKMAKNINHLLSNPELQNTFLRNKTMQNQLLNQLKQEYNNNKTEVNKSNYITVNSYLSNLNLESDEYEQKEPCLYMNQSDKDINTDFEADEAELERRFKREEEIRRAKFRAEQKKRRQEYLNKINEFKDSSVDPYKLFKLSKNFSLQELKNTYKKLALVTHPDRPNGSHPKFQIVTKCYMSLLEEYKTRQSDKQYLQLRDESRGYIDLQRNDGYKNIDMTNDQFDINLFNKIYNENRLGEATDDGYDEWIKNNSYDSEDIEKDAIFSDKFNINIFNSVFTDKSKKKCREIVEYKTPQALNSSSNMRCSELGVDSINNYGKSDIKNNELNYSDYKEAYTKTHFIDPKSVKVKQYKDVNDLKNSRSRISYQMSEADLRKQALQKRQEEQQEQHRLKNIEIRDRMIMDNYSRVHKLMLPSKPN